MQIQVPVSEVRQVGCFLCQNQVLRVTTKAKRVILYVEGRIKLWGIFLDQQAKIFASVRGMAAATVLFRNWTVQVFFAFDFLGKGGQNLIFAQFLWFIMASQAEAHRIIFQQKIHCRGMWRMAVHTSADLAYDAMLIRRVFDDFLDVLMAGIAQEGSEILDHL